MTCRGCGEALIPLLDLGPQPVCNRFLKDAGQEEFRQNLTLAQCGACALVQLEEPMPVAEVVARYDWITYREPEGHLDGLAETIVKLPGLSKTSAIGAVTYKDDTLIDRLDRLGFKNHWRLDARSDLGIADPRAGLETIQERLTKNPAQNRRGGADLLIVRHILEHAYDSYAFASALKNLVKPGGYLLFEIPDNARCFETCDYGAIWEEHVLYFTKETFKSFLALAGFEMAEFHVYPYPMEDSLVAIVKAATPSMPRAPAPREKQRAETYVRGLTETAAKFKAVLARYPRGKTALFGAGHRSAAFINLLGLKDSIGMVIDDDVNKKGLFMPGSRLPIVGSAALLEKEIALCLLNMSPESEQKVVAKNKAFVDRGGRFVSIFPESVHA